MSRDIADAITIRYFQERTPQEFMFATTTAILQMSGAFIHVNYQIPTEVCWKEILAFIHLCQVCYKLTSSYLHLDFICIISDFFIVGTLSIYDSYYRDLSRDGSSTELGSITCRTRYSPPTYVTWERDGVAVPVNGDRYEMTQTVTDRGSSYYDSVLLIRDAVDLAGNHTYTCCIRNYVGNTCKSTSTYMRGEVLNRICLGKFF